MILPDVIKGTEYNAEQFADYRAFFRDLKAKCLEKFGEGKFHLRLMGAPEEKVILAMEAHFSSELLVDNIERISQLQLCLDLFKYSDLPLTNVEAGYVEKMETLWPGSTKTTTTV